MLDKSSPIVDLKQIKIHRQISTSTVFPIYGTPLGLCASTYYVDILSSLLFQRFHESRVIAFSVGKPIQKPHFRGGSLFDYFLKIREYLLKYTFLQKIYISSDFSPLS